MWNMPIHFVLMTELRDMSKMPTYPLKGSSDNVVQIDFILRGCRTHFILMRARSNIQFRLMCQGVFLS